MADLRDHVAVDHRQGPDGYTTPLDVVCRWHNLEHRPGRTTHLEHAHDEISAKRYGVRLVAA